MNTFISKKNGEGHSLFLSILIVVRTQKNFNKMFQLSIHSALQLYMWKLAFCQERILFILSKKQGRWMNLTEKDIWTLEWGVAFWKYKMFPKQNVNQNLLDCWFIISHKWGVTKSTKYVHELFSYDRCVCVEWWEFGKEAKRLGLESVESHNWDWKSNFPKTFGQLSQCQS